MKDQLKPWERALIFMYVLQTPPEDKTEQILRLSQIAGWTTDETKKYIEDGEARGMISDGDEFRLSE